MMADSPIFLSFQIVSSLGFGIDFVDSHILLLSLLPLLCFFNSTNRLPKDAQQLDKEVVQQQAVALQVSAIHYHCHLFG
jgi:hypothetical protein